MSRSVSLLPVELLVRNRRGVERPSAPESVRGKSAEIALRAGVRLRLTRQPDDANSTSALPPSEAEKSWENVPRQLVGQFEADALGKPLAPTATALALQVDLRDLFKIDRPGRYRLEVTLPIPGETERHPFSADFTIGELPAKVGR
jgi:hypothetical protein